MFVKGLRPEPEKSREVEKEAERVCGGVCEQGQHDVMSQPKARAQKATHKFRPFLLTMYERRVRRVSKEENEVRKGTVLNRWHAYVQKGDGEKRF